MGLLDKDNPAEDFYEKKHLNSDLLCCNFTKLTDREFYDALKWANQTLMKNYYGKQKSGILNQIDYLYDTLDVTFRGFRHKGGKSDGSVSVKDSFGGSQKTNNNIQPVNWENTLSKDSDAARFSSRNNGSINLEKNMDSYFLYTKNKKIRQETRKEKKISNLS